MSGTGKCPAGCGKTVLWVTTARRRNMPLDARPDRHGVYIPLRGRAYEPWQLTAMGEPWSDWADAPRHHPHPATCPNWNRQGPDPQHGSARGHLACTVCGTVDATVRHSPVGDRCSLCRRSGHVELPSTVEPAENTPAGIPGKIIVDGAV